MKKEQESANFTFGILWIFWLGAVLLLTGMLVMPILGGLWFVFGGKVIWGGIIIAVTALLLGGICCP